MSSNYPPGVSSGTYGAPWNDEEFEFEMEVTIKVRGGISKAGPASYSDSEIIADVEKMIKDSLVVEHDNIDDFEVISTETTIL